MTDKKQPEALRLAAWLKAGGFINMTIDDTVAIVNELVTQHEQITELQAREPVFQWTGTEADDAMLLLARMDDRLDPERIAQLEKIIPRMAARVAELEAQIAGAARNPQARSDLARAIWSAMREHEDSCVLALEDVPANHCVWDCADAAMTIIGAGGVTELCRAPALDRGAFERAALKDKPDRNIGSVEGLYFSPWVQAAWTGFKFAAAIAQEGGK